MDRSVKIAKVAILKLVNPDNIGLNSNSYITFPNWGITKKE